MESRPSLKSGATAASERVRRTRCAFGAALRETKAFLAVAEEHRLLIAGETTASGTCLGERKFGSFEIVNADGLVALPDEVLGHRVETRWLSAIGPHLASLRR